jgi:Ca-activated chloride channel family protein
MALVAVLAAPLSGQRPESAGQEPFRFKGGVDFVAIHATITDATGRFVPNLRKEDFAVYEDDRRVEVTHFSVDRAPVSLGVALDTSDSMAGDKIKAARRALEGLLRDLGSQRDEIFLYRFGDSPILVQDWTVDRPLVVRVLDRTAPTGGTALYDTVAEAIAHAATGRNQKKALLIISDGNDTSSRIGVRDLQERIRASDAIVYAIGIDGPPTYRLPPGRQRPPRLPVPFPPAPGGRGRGRFLQLLPGAQGAGAIGGASRSRSSDPANVGALRDLTDDSGGRTEVLTDVRQLERTVAGIADELGQQYYLGYSSPGEKDGRWHTIRVEVEDATYHIRARRGYTAN